MYEKLLNYLKEKPMLYAASTAPFWDDAHISKGMLAAHLNLDLESASRKYDFIVKSVDWIFETFYEQDRNQLLDLGCGPGLYTELFSKEGFQVTGIDFSKRSIEYAEKSAASNNLPITYLYKNYLELDYEDAFDVVTLIYCDFGVLSPENRKTLLFKIRKALKPEGVLILDGFTKREIVNFREGRTVEYYEQGYWSEQPHMCIQNNYLYPETNNYLEQFLIVTEGEVQCFNNWNQIFSLQSLSEELAAAGFEDFVFYDDVTGRPFSDTQKTLCVAARLGQNNA